MVDQTTATKVLSCSSAYVVFHRMCGMHHCWRPGWQVTKLGGDWITHDVGLHLTRRGNRLSHNTRVFFNPHISSFYPCPSSHASILLFPVLPVNIIKTNPFSVAQVCKHILPQGASRALYIHKADQRESCHILFRHHIFALGVPLES